MKHRPFLGVLAVAAAVAAPASVQGADPPDLDVPFVPTHEKVVSAMLEMASVDGKDVLYDLGCGDGRIVITAAKKHGIRGRGYDLDPERIRESRRNAKRAGVSERVEFEVKDLFDVDLREASVVTLYLLPSVNLKLRPKLLRDLRPGTRIVSHDFDMGDWKPDRTERVRANREHVVHLWIVPADVKGAWRVESGDARMPLRLEQEFQQLTGSLDGASIERARIRGDEVRFAVGGGGGERVFRGRIEGDRIEGTVTSKEGSAPFTATRQRRADRSTP